MNIQPLRPHDGDAYYGQNDAVSFGQVRATLLPKCAKCGAKHPWAHKPVLAIDECPECGHPSGRPYVQIVKMRFPGLLGWIVDVLLGWGQSLRRIGERLRS